MKRSILIVCLLAATSFAVTSPAFAHGGMGGGLYPDSHLNIAVEEPPAAVYDLSAPGPAKDMEHDHSKPCASFDCGCLGCQRSLPHGSAFVSVVEVDIPTGDTPDIQIFIEEDISYSSAVIYADPHTSLLLRPPRG